MSSRSTSRYALLGMLSIRPMSGYDIKKLIEASISNFWTESYGQIYPILKTLVAEKLVTRTTAETIRQTGSPRLRAHRGRSPMSCASGSRARPLRRSPATSSS